MTTDQENEWTVEAVSGLGAIVNPYTRMGFIEGYLAACKNRQEESDEGLVIFLNECGFDNSGCYDIEEAKSHFKKWLEIEKEIVVEKRDKLIEQAKDWIMNIYNGDEDSDLQKELTNGLKKWRSCMPKFKTTRKCKRCLVTKTVDNFIPRKRICMKCEE